MKEIMHISYTLMHTHETNVDRIIEIVFDEEGDVNDVAAYII